MNVINNRPRCVQLSQLNGGELFEYDSKLFMRIVVPNSLIEPFKDRPTCTDLQSGRLAKIGWGAYVVPVEADLVVRNNSGGVSVDEDH